MGLLEDNPQVREKERKKEKITDNSGGFTLHSFKPEKVRRETDRRIFRRGRVKKKERKKERKKE